MTVTKRVELDNIGFDVGNDPVKQGQIALRWRKMTYDGDDLAVTEPHRDVIDVDTDVDARLEEVYADLERQGYGRPPESDRGYIDDAIKRAWTPEVRLAVAADRKDAIKREADAAEARRIEQEQAEQRRFDEAVAAAIARRT